MVSVPRGTRSLRSVVGCLATALQIENSLASLQPHLLEPDLTYLCFSHKFPSSPRYVKSAQDSISFPFFPHFSGIPLLFLPSLFIREIPTCQRVCSNIVPSVKLTLVP